MQFLPPNDNTPMLTLSRLKTEWEEEGWGHMQQMDTGRQNQNAELNNISYNS